MADSIIEQIQKSKSLVAKLRKVIADMEADGVDADEAKRIEQNKSQIAQLLADLTKLEQRFEADKNEWNGLSGDLKTVRDQLKTLKDWGTFDLAAIESELSATEAFEQSEDYRDAITRLDEIKTALVKPYAEYAKQSAAMEKYETDLKGIETRLSEAKNSTFRTDAVSEGIARVEQGLPTLAKQADAKDYVAANGLLESTATELGSVEKEITNAKDEDSAVRAEYEPLQTKAAEADAIAFEELQDRIATARAGTVEVGQWIDTFEFTSARSQIMTLSHEFDLIKAEADQLEAARKAEEEQKRQLKEEWERNASRYQDLQKKVAELETWGSSEATNLRALVTEIDGRVASEEYQSAIDAIASAESAVGEPYANYLKQQEAQKTYEASRPPLDSRAQTASGHQYADGLVGTMLNDLDNDLGWMDGMAKDKDFVQANTRIATAGTKLDQIERDLRELETQAKVAEEMGDVSSPEAKREIARRLYVEEQPLARERVNAAVKADVLNESVAAQLEQLVSSLEGAEAQATAENYSDGLDAVRIVIDEMPLIEEAVRKQTEQKKLFDDALAAVKAEIATFNDSPHRRVRGYAATLENSLAEGESLAQAHDYEEARAKADGWRVEVDTIRKVDSDTAKDHAAADAALIEIQSRLDKALANESAELAPGLEGLKLQKAEVDKNYTDEDYAAAVTSIDKLKGLLIEFEEEAETQVQKDLYDAAVDSLSLEQRLADAVTLAYPEAEEQLTVADSCDKDRKSLAEQASYEAARTKAFDEGKALDGFATRKGEIELAKEQYEHNRSTLQRSIDEALAPFDESSDELAEAQGKLKDLKQQLDQAVAHKRYIEALRLGEETAIKADEVNMLRFNLTPIDEPATIEFITSVVTAAATAFGSGSNQAVSDFRVDVLDSVTSERTAQAFSKWSGYLLDVAAAVGDATGTDKIVTPVTTGIKTVISIAADVSDSADDDAERAAAQELISQLEQQAGEVEGSFNGSYASQLKAKASDKFEEIGRFHTRKEYPQARMALKGCGVPMDATVTATKKSFLSQLRTKFKESKR